MNRKKGDQDRIVILTPDGSPFVNSTSKPLGRYKASLFYFTGKPRKSNLWTAGDYTVVWEGLRGGEVFDTETFVITVKK